MNEKNKNRCNECGAHVQKGEAVNVETDKVEHVICPELGGES